MNSSRILIRHQSKRAARCDLNAARCDDCRHYFQLATMITHRGRTLCTHCAIDDLATKERTAP